MSSKYLASLVTVMLLAFSMMAQSSDEKKPITKNEAVEVKSNVVKSITYPANPLINKKMITVHPATLIKNTTLKAKNEENIKLKSNAIKKQ